MKLTNTLFQHKQAHTTIWEGPDKDGKKTRNQIDYILVRKEHCIFVTDSRSYAGLMSFSDHRMVIAKLSIDWTRNTPPKIKSNKYNIEKLRQPEYRKKYQQKVKELLSNMTAESEQQRLDNIVKACHVASEEVLSK